MASNILRKMKRRPGCVLLFPELFERTSHAESQVSEGESWVKSQVCISKKKKSRCSFPSCLNSLIKTDGVFYWNCESVITATYLDEIKLSGTRKTSGLTATFNLKCIMLVLLSLKVNRGKRAMRQQATAPFSEHLLYNKRSCEMSHCKRLFPPSLAPNEQQRCQFSVGAGCSGQWVKDGAGEGGCKGPECLVISALHV